jgi:hypothetical protein
VGWFVSLRRTDNAQTDVLDVTVKAIKATGGSGPGNHDYVQSWDGHDLNLYGAEDSAGLELRAVGPGVADILWVAAEEGRLRIDLDDVVLVTPANEPVIGTTKVQNRGELLDHLGSAYARHTGTRYRRKADWVSDKTNSGRWVPITSEDN